MSLAESKIRNLQDRVHELEEDIRQFRAREQLAGKSRGKLRVKIDRNTHILMEHVNYHYEQYQRSLWTRLLVFFHIQRPKTYMDLPEDFQKKLESGELPMIRSQIGELPP